MTVARRIKTVFTHPWLALAFRLYLGGLFIYAGMYKINYTAEFAETIASYRMVPYWGVNAMAVVLPWAEVTCGVFVLLGLRARTAAALIAGLMAMFTVGVVVNLLRDAPISCGCFQTLGEAISWRTALRDTAWLLMAMHIFFFDRAFHLENRYRLSIREI